MKRERLFSALWAFALSFALSAATTMCIVTAFHMGVDTGLLLRVCAVTALVGSICYALPLSLVPVGGGAVILGYLWQKGILETSCEALLNRLTRQYDRAYGWGIIRWSFRTADDMESDIVGMLCILGAVISLLCAWSICRRKSTIPALVISFLSFVTCFVVNDTVPDTPWLFLLLLGFLILMMTGPVRRQDEQQGNRLCLWLTPVAALALLVLFAAIPRDSYNRQEAAKRFADSIVNQDSVQLLLGRMDGNNAVSVTDTNAVDLKTVGYRVESQAQVLQVTAPYTGTVYLRGRALDAYDGKSWQQSDINYSSLYWPSHQLEVAGEITITTRFAHRMLYIPYYTDLSQMQEFSMGMVNDKNLTEYSFPCRKPADPAPWSVSTAGTSIAQYIPMDETVQQWAQPIADKLTANSPDIYRQAQSIASYVRNSATYNTRTPRMPATGKDFAQWFLEESDTGYCVHFATAATVLLQAAGIPARYVTGYMVQVTEGQQVTVYADQAHAWAEYLLPGFGWTVLEATPEDTTSTPEETTGETVNSTTPQFSTPTAPQQTDPTHTPTQTPKTDRDWVLWTLLSVVAICALITIAEGQRRLRLRSYQKKLDSATPNEKALLYWHAVTVYAALLQQTPEKDLFSLAEKAKFSQYTITQTQLQEFEIYLQRATQQLRRHNVFRRLYYRFILTLY